MARAHVATALGRLREAVQRAHGLGEDVQAMADACHGMWVLTAALSTGSSDNVSGLSAPRVLDLPPAAQAGRRLIDEVAFLLSALCLEGPTALRPALLPCIGLLVLSRCHLLSLHPSLLESLRTGLLSPSRALRARALETVVGILNSSPPGAQDANVVARQVAGLQTELLSFVAAEVPCAMTTAALAALEALTDASMIT